MFWKLKTLFTLKLLADPAILQVIAPRLPVHPKAETENITAWLGSGYRRQKTLAKDLNHPRILTLSIGEHATICGPNALQNAHWWLAQALFSGQLDEVVEHIDQRTMVRHRLGAKATKASKAKRAHLYWPGSTDTPAKGETSLICQENNDYILPSSTHVVSPPPISLSPYWWNKLTTRVGAKKVPRLAERLTWLFNPRQLKQAQTIGRANLSVPIGFNPAEPQVFTHLDLAAAGPHALLAGTSGSGKSEALLTWLLLLCAQNSPQQLQLILIDYKGGATFDRLKSLPHLQGVLTDLQPTLTNRVIAALELELKRRENLFKDHRIVDFLEWETSGSAPLPRLIIAVDEFRELTQHAPNLMKHLTRLATQGRSLGMHLILATQHPRGVMDQQLRANCPLRICLRVTDPMDSADLIGSSVAAQISPTTPGRAWILHDSLESCQIHYFSSTQRQRICQTVLQANSDFMAKPFWGKALPQKLSSTDLTQIESDRNLLLATKAGEARDETDSSSNNLAIGLLDTSPMKDPETLVLKPGELLLWADRSSNPKLLEMIAAQAKKEKWELFVLTLEGNDLTTTTRGRVKPSDSESLSRSPLAISSQQWWHEIDCHIFDWHFPVNWLNISQLISRGPKLLLITHADQLWAHLNQQPQYLDNFQRELEKWRQLGLTVILQGSFDLAGTIWKHQADYCLLPVVADPIVQARWGLFNTDPLALPKMPTDAAGMGEMYFLVNDQKYLVKLLDSVSFPTGSTDTWEAPLGFSYGHSLKSSPTTTSENDLHSSSYLISGPCWQTFNPPRDSVIIGSKNRVIDSWLRLWPQGKEKPKRVVLSPTAFQAVPWEEIPANGTIFLCELPLGWKEELQIPWHLAESFRPGFLLARQQQSWHLLSSLQLE
ncbi:FtsK/SpoIIIE domain-containing protein [Boudabousia tangfeifanii]|nr:FtsK/SpoIIIE domain-containing protein [Boudabousia tangfeifanii]